MDVRASLPFSFPSDNAVDYHSTQLIDGDATFNLTGLESFLKDVKLDDRGLSYVVVSIMGPQSSGKSTLMNHLFGTNFREMDALAGRSQTTRGIWLAKAVGIEPPTLVMDLEGTDGAERGEDDTAFEKQSALFALATSDIVLINMWCHDIGRVQAANMPLLKTVFQAMMRMFHPRKKTLMFVLRDITLTPMEHLGRTLRNAIHMMWNSVSKPPEHRDTRLSDFFRVEVVGLPTYERMTEQFKEEVSQLRRRFSHSLTHGGLVEDQSYVIPASGFSFSSQQIWKAIREDKDLDHPAHYIMVASYRCEEIGNEKYSTFKTNEEWCQMEEAVQTGPVPNFGKKLTRMIATSLAGYESEARYYEEGVRSRKGKELEQKLLHLVRPAFQLVVGRAKSISLERFRKEVSKALTGEVQSCSTARHCTQHFVAKFDKECRDALIEQGKWDLSKVRKRLLHDLDAHISSKREELARKYEETLKNNLTDSLEVLFNEVDDKTWSAVRELLQRETEDAVSRYSAALFWFELDEQAMRDCARGIVEEKARQKAKMVFASMKTRFSAVLNGNSDSTPRDWSGKEHFEAIKANAYSASLKLLSVMAAIRLDGVVDNINDILSAALLKKDDADESNTSGGPLASMTWEQVPPSKTLITPNSCQRIWRTFMIETDDSVTKAEATWKHQKWERRKRAVKEVGIPVFNGVIAISQLLAGLGSSSGS